MGLTHACFAARRDIKTWTIPHRTLPTLLYLRTYYRYFASEPFRFAALHFACFVLPSDPYCCPDTCTSLQHFVLLPLPAFFVLTFHFACFYPMPVYRHGFVQLWAWTGRGWFVAGHILPLAACALCLLLFLWFLRAKMHAAVHGRRLTPCHLRVPFTILPLPACLAAFGGCADAVFPDVC